MTVRFDDEVAIVTGAGHGLGRAYALELARRGARVVVNDLGGTTAGVGSDESAASRVVEEIKSLGGDAVASFESVATREGGLAIVAKALEHFGRIDALIANAGILRDKSFLKLEEGDIKAVLDVHLLSAFHVGQPAFAAMKQSGRGGRIVFTTSSSGLWGNFGQANYAAAKMGLVGLMRTLAIEGAKTGIKVNAVAPVAATRLMAGVETMEDTPLNPRNVAPMAVFLASNATPTSGEVFFATGGWYARVPVVMVEGWVAGAGENTVDGLAAHWNKVCALSGAVELANGMDTAKLMQEKLKVNLGA